MKDAAGYSALSLSGDHIEAIHSKDSDHHRAGLIDLGMYFYPRDVFDRISNLQPSARGETEVWDLNGAYAHDNQLLGFKIKGWWSDAGSSIEEYASADRHYEAAK